MKKKEFNAAGASREDKALEQFAQVMIEKIETIKRDWKKPWFTEGALGWAQNMCGRQYNGMNAIFLALVAEKYGYDVPVWCTFNRLTSYNYVEDPEKGATPAKDKEGKLLPRVMVKKGEKSVPVILSLHTVINNETKEKITYESFRALSAEEKQDYRVFTRTIIHNVFNIAQTNFAETRPEEYAKIKARVSAGEKAENFAFPAMDDMIAGNKWLCPIKPTYGDKACFSISKDEIIIPEKQQFINGESYYSNLWHEMAHSTGIKSRLGRYEVSDLMGEGYAKEELVAELSAALVGMQYGLKKNIKTDSCAYIKGWLAALKEKPAFIKTVLQDVKKASGLIIQAIEGMQTVETTKKAS